MTKPMDDAPTTGPNAKMSAIQSVMGRDSKSNATSVLDVRRLGEKDSDYDPKSETLRGTTPKLPRQSVRSIVRRAGPRGGGR